MSQRSGPAGPSGPTTTVYKLGGSLLTLPDLGRRLRGFLSHRTNSQPLLVVGGGPTAELVREWDRVHHLGEEPAHRLALRSLTLNESLLLELLPESRSVTTRQAAEDAWNAAQIPVLRVQQFLNAEEETAEGTAAEDRGSRIEDGRSQSSIFNLQSSMLVPPLPHTWDVTSDSIAAWIALRWPADELVLLKSCPLPEIGQSDHRTIGQGDTPEHPIVPRPLVDPYFQNLVPHLRRLGWVNLRDEEPRLQPCSL